MRTATPPSSAPRVTRLGATAVLIAVVGWAITNILVKIAQVPAVTFAFYRLWAGGVVMLLVLAVTRRRLTWQMVKASFLGGVIFGFNVTLFFLAIKNTSVAEVLIIQALQPALILMVASPLFGERVSRYDVLWTLVSVCGVAVVALGSSSTPVWSLRGDMFAVGSLFCWAAYFPISKHARRSVPAIQYMTTVTLTAALVSTPLALLSGERLGIVRWQDWAWLGAFLVAAQGGHVLVAWAHSQVDVSISSLLILAQPIIAAIAAVIFLDEPLPALAIAGGLVVVASVAAIVKHATAAGGGEEIGMAETSPA
jgi:drug/metabolite transporter (DMT)-like permease